MSWQAARALMVGVCVLLGAAIVSPSRADAAELVMFVEAGCPWCIRWDREIGEAYEHSEEGRIAPLRRMNIADARRSGIRLASAVSVTPTFVLIEDGIEVGRITGHPGADFFWGMLDALIARLPSLAPGRPVDGGRGTGRQAFDAPPAPDGACVLFGLGKRSARVESSVCHLA